MGCCVLGTVMVPCEVPVVLRHEPQQPACPVPLSPECVFTATVAAMYYSYYMLPDGTYCLAPPPPGVDVATYYSTLPAAVAVSSTAGVTATAPPPPGTTPPPPPTTAETSSGVTSSTITTRYALVPADYVALLCSWVGVLCNLGYTEDLCYLRLSKSPSMELMEP